MPKCAWLRCGWMAAVWMVGACGGNAQREAAEASQVQTAQAQVPAEAAAKPVAVGSSVEETGYSLRLVEAGPYKAGELGRVVLKLTPRGEFHINQDYPFQVSLTADAATQFAKADLARSDAAEFAENSARFEVPFTPGTAGDHKLSANVKFAVCTAENCIPDERELALLINASAGK